VKSTLPERAVAVFLILVCILVALKSQGPYLIVEAARMKRQIKGLEMELAKEKYEKALCETANKGLQTDLQNERTGLAKERSAKVIELTLPDDYWTKLNTLVSKNCAITEDTFWKHMKAVCGK
jgi:hypothetical protein